MTQAPRNLPNTYYLSLVTVDPAAELPLYRQIYQGMREAILTGRLAAGTRLPSTRDAGRSSMAIDTGQLGSIPATRTTASLERGPPE